MSLCIESLNEWKQQVESKCAYLGANRIVHSECLAIHQTYMQKAKLFDSNLIRNVP